MQNPEKNLQEDREPFLPRFLARPIGLMAYNWVMNKRWINYGDGPTYQPDVSASRFIGAVSLAGVEVALPSFSRSYIRAINQRKERWSDEESAVRFFGGLVFDAITIGGAITIGVMASNSTYDAAYGWNMGIATKLALNTAAHLVVDGIRAANK